MRDLSSAIPPLAALAAQALGWSPETFWHATPAELASALGPMGPAQERVTRSDFDTLMEQYPDA